MLRIILSVKRIWGFYLHPGTTLLFVALFALLGWNVVSNVVSKLAKNAASIGIGSLVLFCVITSIHSIAAFSELARRTQKEEYFRQQREYQHLQNVISEYQRSHGRLIRVCVDANFFQPPTSSVVQVFTSYGTFNRWNEGFDLVVLTHTADHEDYRVVSVTSYQHIYVRK